MKGAAIVEAGVGQGWLAFTSVSKRGFGKLEFLPGCIDHTQRLPGLRVCRTHIDCASKSGDSGVRLAFGEESPALAEEFLGILGQQGKYEHTHHHGEEVSMGGHTVRLESTISTKFGSCNAKTLRKRVQENCSIRL